MPLSENELKQIQENAEKLVNEMGWWSNEANGFLAEGSDMIKCYIAGATAQAEKYQSEVAELKAGITDTVTETINFVQAQRLNDALVKAIINKPGLVPQICANEIRKNEKLTQDLASRDSELRELRQQAKRDFDRINELEDIIVENGLDETQNPPPL